MTTTELALPKNGDAAQWNDQEKAIVEAAGLVTRGRNGAQELAPRATVEAFLAHCQRTQLDPIARQIYAICRKGRWGIQISIDGARLIAERSGKYAGQTPVEWTGDGQTWTEVWLDNKAPAAARVGVHRADFREPLYAVANFSAYAAGGPMWDKMPSLMIAKCAEMLALRKAFPQDLSGLYSTEEMDQAGTPAQPAQQAQQQQQTQQQPRAAEPVADEDGVIEAEVVEDEPEVRPVQQQWLDAINFTPDVETLRALWAEAGEKGAMNDGLRAVFTQRSNDLKAAA